MRLKKILIFLVSVFCLSSCFGPKSYRCNFLPETDAPQWVISGAPSIPGFYVGTAGVGKSIHGPEGQISEAKKRAIEDLAASIRVFIKNEVNIYKSSEENKNLTESISQHIVNMSLGNIQQDGRWLNRDACILYVRVKLDKEIADRMLKNHMDNIRKFNSSQSLYILSKNNQLTTEERLKYLEDANNLLKEIDFNALSISKITSMGYPFYFNRNSSMIEDINRDTLGLVEYKKLEKAISYHNLAQSERFTRTTRIRNVNRAISILAAVDFEKLENSSYIQNEKKYYLNRFYGTRSYLRDKVRFYITPGMKESKVIALIGKPIEKTKTYYLPIFEKGFRYKNHWIIFKNGIVDCIVHYKGFRLNPGGLCRSCEWHRKHHPRYVVK